MPRTANAATWQAAHEALRARGLRWTPQRRLVLKALSDSDGHVTAADLLDRCRSQDPQTIPSTVYRTLDMLEEIGLVRHGHGPDGREEFHVLPEAEHGHLYCGECGRSWEIDRHEAAVLVDGLAAGRGFATDLSHLSISGVCRECRAPS